MSENNAYRYIGLPLTSLMAQELILELFTGKTIVVLTHLERGGNPVRSKQNPITRALTLLKKAGHAENPLPGIWTISS